MIKKPLISVIIPVYNAQKRLSIAIESVLKQTYENFQIILIDDGSIDDSPQICDKYQKFDSRILVIHQENKRVSAARNQGIDTSSGEYLIFLDSDDEISPFTLETCLDKFEKTNADIVIFGMNFDYYQVEELKKSEQLSIDNEICFDMADIKVHFFYLANQNYLVSACNKMIRSKIIKENHLYFEVEMSILEDFKFVLDLLGKSQKIYATPKVFYHYYHDLSLSEMKRRPLIDYFRNFQILDQRLRAFSQNYSLDKETKEARINGMIFRYYLIAVEKIFSGSGSFLEKSSIMKTLVKRKEVLRSAKCAEVNGLRLKLVLFLFKKKCYKVLAILFYLNDWLRENFLSKKG